MLIEAARGRGPGPRVCPRDALARDLDGVLAWASPSGGWAGVTRRKGVEQDRWFVCPRFPRSGSDLYDEPSCPLDRASAAGEESAVFMSQLSVLCGARTE